MRVLLTAHGAYGHVLPLVGVARALADRGHELRLAVGDDLDRVASALGVPTVTAGMSNADVVAEARRRWPQTAHEPPARWAARMFTDIAAPAMARDVAQLIAGWRPDIVLREEGEHGGPVAAAAARVPWATHGWGSPLPGPADREDVAVRLGPLWRAYGLGAPSAADLYGGALVSPCPPSLDGDPPRAVSVRRVRPTVPNLGPSDETWHLPGGEPLAYVGFGTVPLYRDRPAATVLVVRAVLAAGLGAVVTTPDPELARALRALDPDRVRVADWLPLERTVSACAVVVSHGGAGTTLAALAAGVPLVLLPAGSPSQLRMSAACAAAGAARVVGPADVTRAALDAALDELGSDARFHAQARALARQIAALPPAETVAELLEHLADDATRPGGHGDR